MERPANPAFVFAVEVAASEIMDETLDIKLSSAEQYRRYLRVRERMQGLLAAQRPAPRIDTGPSDDFRQLVGLQFGPLFIAAGYDAAWVRNPAPPIFMIGGSLSF